MANPGPPPTVEVTTAAAPSSAAPVVSSDQSRTRAVVAINDFPFGFNPHLRADNSQLVADISALVFPSAFNSGVLNANLLSSASEVAPPAGVAQRIRYSLNPQAQWSDGAPITGADFEYLWQGIVTTPGARNAGLYQAISNVTTSQNGRVIDVDLTTRVADWTELFAFLLPAHLLDSTDFATALQRSIPASAGRYSVESIDVGRGQIVLNRNDRFWGKAPVDIDVLELRGVRDSEQATALMRSGQVRLVDVWPTQTLREQLELLGDVTLEIVSPTRQLRLEVNSTSETFHSAELRRTFLSLIDTAQVARLATGRTVDVTVPYSQNSLLNTASEDQLRQLSVASQENPVRIGVDPTNPTALRAAETIKDSAGAKGVVVDVQESRLGELAAAVLSRGELDAVITVADTSVDAANIASFFACTSTQSSALIPSASAAPSSDASQPVNASFLEPAKFAGNFSRFCPTDAANTQIALLAGEMDPSAGLSRIREINAQEALYLPLLDESRYRAIHNESEVTAATSDWTRGLSSATLWDDID
ncbi:MAG: ABC transporter family substrate-binding protein [Corynebacterium sp.]|nr:ABC transporter family substrate-binding protein [Corynebacterium sp.]